MSNTGTGLYGSGFARDDWYMLKNVLIEYSREDIEAGFVRLPPRLRGSSVGQEIEAYLRTGDAARRDHAVALMAPGMSNVMLLLEKG